MFDSTIIILSLILVLVLVIIVENLIPVWAACEMENTR